MGKMCVASLLHGYDMSERTVYRYTFRIQTSGTADRKPGSGGQNREKTYLKELKVRKFFDHNTGVSQRKCAHKLGLSLVDNTSR